MKPKLVQKSLEGIPDFFEPRIVSGCDLPQLFAEARIAGFWPWRMASVRNGVYEIKFLRNPSQKSG